MELAWKTAEKDAAEYFGGKRRKMHRYKVQGPDIRLSTGNVELKQRASLPKWISNPFKKYSKEAASGLFSVMIVEKGVPPEEGFLVMTARQGQMLMNLHKMLKEQIQKNPNLTLSDLLRSSDQVKPQ